MIINHKDGQKIGQMQWLRVKSPYGSWGMFRTGYYKSPLEDSSRTHGMTPGGREYINAFAMGTHGSKCSYTYSDGRAVEVDVDVPVTLYVDMNDIVVIQAPDGTKACPTRWHVRETFPIGQAVVGLTSDGKPVKGIVVGLNEGHYDPENLIFHVLWEGETHAHGGGDGKVVKIYFDDALSEIFAV